MVESSGLLNRRRGLNLYRGFESPPLRQINHLRPISRTLGSQYLTGAAWGGKNGPAYRASLLAGTAAPICERPMDLRKTPPLRAGNPISRVPCARTWPGIYREPAAAGRPKAAGPQWTPGDFFQHGRAASALRRKGCSGVAARLAAASEPASLPTGHSGTKAGTGRPLPVITNSSHGRRGPRSSRPGPRSKYSASA